MDLADLAGDVVNSVSEQRRTVQLGDLTAAQLRELQAGDPLTFPPSEEPPMAVGDEIVLEQSSGIAFTEKEVASGVGVASPVATAPVLWVEVTEIRRTRKLQWRVLYRTYDHRPLWLKRGPPKPEGSRLRQRTWTPIEEHGLTTRHANALDDAETVPGGYQNVIEMGARLKAAERDERRREDFESQCKSFSAAIRGIGREAAKQGIDAGALLAPLLRDYKAAVEAASENDEAA